MSTKPPDGLLADEAPIVEIDELRALIGTGQERGFLTFEEIAACLEEVEVTKEQVQELHTYLEGEGIEVVTADGRLATSEGQRVEAAAEARKQPVPDAPKSMVVTALALVLRTLTVSGRAPRWRFTASTVL